LKPKNFLPRHQLKIVLRRAMLEEFLRNHADRWPLSICASDLRL
jgi:hypothetical protein